MPKVVKASEATSRRRQPPARDVEDREQQLIYEATELAANQIRAGTASAQVITHFLKLGSTTAKLEAEKLMRENELLKAKAEVIASQKSTEELYLKALKAMRSYSGDQNTEVDEYD